MAARRRARRGRDRHDEAPERDEEPERDEDEVDLHDLRPDEALARARTAVHRARRRGAKSVVVVTGAGWGNHRNEPVLRTRVEQWATGPEGRAWGVLRFERVARGGALRLFLR